MIKRSARLFYFSAIALLLLILAAVITGVVAVQSGWLNDRIRERIVSAAQDATGGAVDIKSFSLDWHSLTAEVRGLTIRGMEPANTAPLLYIDRAVVGFRIISLFEKKFDVSSVRVESPRAHIIIEADGMTNLPQPHTRSGKSIPETILNLRIGRFDLVNGLFMVQREGDQDIVPWSGSGEQLKALVTYTANTPRYDAQVSVAPVDIAWNGIRLRALATGKAAMEKNRVTVSSATVTTGDSRFDFSNVLVNGFTAPVTTGQFHARVALSDADRVFKLVNFQHTGDVDVTGNLRFTSRADYSVTGELRGAGIGYGRIRNIRLTGRMSATPDRVDLRSMIVNALGGTIRAEGDVRKVSDFHVRGQMEKFDARELAALANRPTLPYDAVLSGPFDASGKLAERSLHNLVAGATLDVMPAANGIPVHGQIAAKFTGATGTVELGTSWLELPSTRLDVTGTLGQKLDVKLQSKDLSDLQPVLNSITLPATFPAQRGSVTFEGTVTGPVLDSLDQLHIAGRGSAQNAIYEGHRIDSLTGTFTVDKTRLTASAAELSSDSLKARGSGSIGLSAWKPAANSPVDANVQLTNADVPTLLALAGEKDVPLSGTLRTTARVTGTVGDPHVTADLNLAKGQIYGEPYDTITGRAQYANGSAETLTAAIAAGRKRVNANLRLDGSDRLTFNISTNAIALSDVALARREEPGLAGNVQMKADGIARVARGTQPQFEDLNADINATRLTLNSRALGDAHLTATTKNGLLTAHIDSDIARSTIHGDGTVRLSGAYPIDARLTFSKLGLNAVTELVRGASASKQWNLDGSAAGDVTITGLWNRLQPVDALNAAINVTQLEIHPLVVTGEAKNIPNLSLKNTGAIHATLAKSTLRFETAHFTAPSTDLALSGTVALNAQSPLNLQVQGNMNLALAETFNAELNSMGNVSINAGIRGTFTNPDISGRAELQKGDFHFANFSNGLTNANGVILFSGTRATIQSLSAESGGGKVDVTGFAALAGGLNTFRVEAKTRGVRVRYPEGVSTISDSDLTLAGTSQRSEASGTVTVRRVAINPKSDVSQILAAASEPLQAPQAGSDFLSNLHLDVQIETAPDVAFETSVAQSIEADANLRLRGTAASPAVLGRIDITQGELSFFGNKYTINQGTISFFDPSRIDPILNVDLETKARGVDVVITVSGPIRKLNASYRSDPPLQFSDIVALLTTGRTPTDPTLAVRDTGQSQSLQQMGATALIGQAIANPVAGRLQRFFGVSRIKIDPQLTGITGSPEARLTIEQQITPDLLFTYINDVSSTSTQLIRVEWDFNRRWAAILTREENGYVGIDFAYKKRFK